MTEAIKIKKLTKHFRKARMVDLLINIKKNCMCGFANRFLLMFIMICVAFLYSFAQSPAEELMDDFGKYYEQYDVDGSAVVYDEKNNKYYFYNKAQYTEMFTPASTFKICNSLIGLETGVIKDENFVIKWDGVDRGRPEWNKDQDMKSAFRNSTVWYYQEMARRVGGERMKHWLEKANYGNRDTLGGIDQFWLAGNLRISPEQQIAFLKLLHDGNLPFAIRTMEIVKKIMIKEGSKANYIVRAKTGWGGQETKEKEFLNIGWYVGYIEADNNVYYFSNCIQSSDDNNPDFVKARIEIMDKILNELKIYE